MFTPLSEEQFNNAVKSGFSPQQIAENELKRKQMLTPQQKDHGFLGNVAAGVAKPFARLGTNLVNAAQIATGNKQTQPFSGDFLGEVKPVGMSGNFGADVKDALGTGLDVASNLPIGAGVGGIAKAGIKGAIKQGVKTGIKTGAAAGAMQGLGGSLQNNEDAFSTGINTIGGGLLGGILGGATGGVTAGIGKGIRRITPIGRAEANLAKETAQTGKITEMISPNPTAKQAQLAQREGRLLEGQDRTFFKHGTPDKILPSTKVQSASKTIVQNIPNAHKMKPSELYTAVEGKIGETAKNLRPHMEATPIKPETIQKINGEWQNLKKSQIDASPATEEANVIKRQKKFESFLQKSGSNHQGDLWDTRITYDNSIPDAVKKATSESSESLQLQKEEWLQNRAILNDAINDTISGMGKTSQDAFKKMSDLYEARTNLQSKAKVKKTVPASKLYEILTGKTAKTIGAGAALIGVPYAVARGVQAASAPQK